MKIVSQYLKLKNCSFLYVPQNISLSKIPKKRQLGGGGLMSFGSFSSTISFYSDYVEKLDFFHNLARKKIGKLKKLLRTSYCYVS